MYKSQSLKVCTEVNKMVEFVSYDGKYPNLCSGELVVKIDGEEVNLGRCLRSGGGCYISFDGDEHVTTDDWEIEELPAAYEKYRKEIEKVANENVPWGCCGGCL